MGKRVESFIYFISLINSGKLRKKIVSWPSHSRKSGNERMRVDYDIKNFWDKLDHDNAMLYSLENDALAASG